MLKHVLECTDLLTQSSQACILSYFDAKAGSIVNNLTDATTVLTDLFELLNIMIDVM